MAVLTYEATFVAMAGKTTDDLAAACFVEWICKMSVPQFIDTNLSKDQAEDLKEELNTCLNQDIPHNPFIDANKKAVDGIRKMVNTAKLRWQAFLLALNLAHNTAYQSTIASSPFEALYGYKTKIPISNLEAISLPSTFTSERMLILKKAIELA